MTDTNQTSQTAQSGQSKNITMAIVAYIVFFVPLLTEYKNDPFVRYHVRQGFALFICGIAISILGSILPWFLYWITSLLGLTMLILFIMGIINASKGEEKPLPLIGKFAEQLKI
jgi:uncharacterized membrane protein